MLNVHHGFQGRGVYDESSDESGQLALAEAERVLLDIADYVYAHTSLKPISKTLFFISRCLCVAKLGGGASTAAELRATYDTIRASLNGTAPGDDYDFPSVVAECDAHVPHVLEAINKVCQLTAKHDSLGLVFNTLLRGKFEGGEGLGTFLTPEEVVFPMVDMLLEVVDKDALAQLGGSSPLLYGDICGGTGRFVYALARRLESRGVPRSQIQNAARLFDQSLMAVDLGRLNFLFEGMQPQFAHVGDSLIAPQVSALRSRFLLLATNPPFGSNKYRWHQDLADSLPAELLAAAGLCDRGHAADPSELFFFRNLDLLAPGGVLAIVLPDGVVQSESFRQSLTTYEHVRKTDLHLAAVVSLPTVTFALGGTVAKTSFLIIQKQKEPRDIPLYVAVAHHIGFVKRGKMRADDPRGNDLTKIAAAFAAGDSSVGGFVDSWRTHESFVAARLLHSLENDPASQKRVPLSECVEMARDFQKDIRSEATVGFHVSVLDVDETGLLDIVAASKNQPASKGLQCQPRDILISCMNPKIWRVAVIPSMVGAWSCSPEFLVLRPKEGTDSWKVALALHHPSVMRAVQSMARGTSSSRQRVPKDRVLSVTVPDVEVTASLAQYIAWREDSYEKRLQEARAYQGLHEGKSLFSW